MIMFFALLLVSFEIIIASDCKSSCRFVYEKRDLSDYNTELVPVNAAENFTGVVTVKGSYNSTCLKGWDFLRFRKMQGTQSKNQPLIFRMEATRISVSGRYKRVNSGDSCAVGYDYKTNQRCFTNSKQVFWTSQDIMRFIIQISDQTSAESYDMFINGQNLKVDYGSKETWDYYVANNYTLKAANSIRSDLFCNKYSSIMICNDAQPRICESAAPPQLLSLGASYTLTCKAVGSPILEVNWLNPDGTECAPDSCNTSLSEDNDKLTSILTIQYFAAKHSGVYTCTVRNQNYKLTASRTFNLTYSELPIQVVAPDSTTYNKEDEKKFVWIVTGWPLDKLMLSCTDDWSNVTPLPYEDNLTDTSAPKRIFTYQKSSGITFYSKRCDISNGSRILDTTTITYQEDIVVIPPTNLEYTNKPAVSKVWTINGYPLDNVTLSCNSSYSVDKDTWSTRVNFIIVFQTKDAKPATSIKCVVKDGNKLMNTTVIIYVQDVKVTQAPAETYFKQGEDDKLFEWIVTGWPLDKIEMHCDTAEVGVNTSSVNKSALTKTLTIQTTNQTTSSNITCSITEGSTLLNTTTITRVGYSCNKDSYGQGKDCIPCPQGKTSPPESDDPEKCVNITSQCPAGEYGIGHDCYLCPAEKTSSEYTIEEDDCYDMPIADIEEPKTDLVLAIGGAGGGAVFCLLLVCGLWKVGFMSTKTKPQTPDDKRDAKVPLSVPVHIVLPLQVLPLATQVEQVTVHQNRFGLSNNDKIYSSIESNFNMGLSSDDLYSHLDHHEESRSNRVTGDVAEDGLYAKLGDRKDIDESSHELDMEDLYATVNREKSVDEFDVEDELYAKTYADCEEDGENSAVEKGEAMYAVMDRSVFKGRGLTPESKKGDVLYSTIQDIR